MALFIFPVAAASKMSFGWIWIYPNPEDMQKALTQNSYTGRRSVLWTKNWQENLRKKDMSVKKSAEAVLTVGIILMS